MKGLKIISLGIAIWGLSLLWPDINLLLSPRVMAGLGMILGIVTLVQELLHHYLKRRRHLDNGPRNDHASRPIPPIALARR